jgi:serine/threonine protein kinase
MSITNLTPTSATGKIYTLEKELGHGKYSVVYQGQQQISTPTSPHYAIKIPHIEIPRKYRQNLVTFETEFFQKLNSPHFIKYIDHGLDIRTPYLVLEIIPETIEDKIRNRTITPQLIISFLKQIPNIIQELAQHNLVHGDLRSKNIAYKNKTLIILDPLPEITRKNPNLKNCPIDYAPEIKDSGTFSLQSDIFSLGKTFEYTLQTQQKIPTSLITLISEMTHPQPYRRPTPTQLSELCQETLFEIEKQHYSTKIGYA